VSNYYKVLLATMLVLAVGGTVSCGGGAQKPNVEILSPPSGSQVPLGQEVQVQYRASDAAAVLRVDLEVEGKVVDSQNSPVPDGQPTMNGVLRWLGDEPGTHTLLVYAYNTDRVASDPVGLNVTVTEGEAAPGSTVTISLIMKGATSAPVSATTSVTPVGTTTPQGPGATAIPTKPTLAATATSPPPFPTATRQSAAPPPPTATQPPPPTATKPAPSPTPLANLWVENHTSVDICEVYFSPPSESWGSNRLLAGNRIYAGQSALWTVPPGNYDLWALDCNGNGLVVISNQPIHGDWVWEIYTPLPPPPPPQSVTLTVYNYCSQDIGRLYIYQPSDPNKGPNELSGPIPIGGNEIFSLDPGWWAITAEDGQGNHLDHMNSMEFLAGDSPMWNACAAG
jgi:hypothetical protein